MLNGLDKTSEQPFRGEDADEVVFSANDCVWKFYLKQSNEKNPCKMHIKDTPSNRNFEP
jgi:hypothetical protein